MKIAFDDFLPDSSFKKLSGGVYIKDEKLYTVYDITDKRLVIREENAVCGTDILLHVPQSYKEYFRQSGKWLNFLSVERMLQPFGLVLIHAAGVLYGDRIYLFSAPSGVGKSTQAGLWQKEVGAEIINGDKMFLGIKNGELIAYGNPSAGTSGIYKNISAPVGGIFMLEQGKENHLELLSKRQAMLYLYSEAIKSAYDKKYNESLLNLIHEITEHIEVYKFKCLPNKSAVDHILDYLKRGN